MNDEDIEHSAEKRSFAAETPGVMLRDQGKDERAVARVQARRREARDTDRREPLRRRLLEALARGSATPTILAELAEAAVPSVSRSLRLMLDAGLVEVGEIEGDGRLRAYALTREGEVRLRDQHAFGDPRPTPEPPDLGERLKFLRAALRNAVAMRRKTNGLEEAADRLRIVRDEASKLQFHELELEAIAELTTTLRQERRIAAMKALLDDLEQIALGRHSNGDPALALPAAAHREYTLGRLPEMHGGGDPCTRARHLDAAQSLFGQLARSTNDDRGLGWKVREAWSIVSLASNLRERSRLEEALDRTGWAKSLFDELEDSYGQSRCLFMFGFCERLMGDFEQAWSHLDQANALATANSFQRFQADSLMQMGEVLRCQGQVVDARALLDEAFERSARMKLVVTQAFAKSALGAVAYEEERLKDAQVALGEADALFAACRHGEGYALNDRRRAIVERRLETMAKRSDFSSARRLALRALERYRALHSPAGMAACEIETGRLELMRGGRVDQQASNLIKRLDDTRQLNLLELDPWVPKVLVRFAAEVEHAELMDRAQQLVQASERRLADWAKQGVVGRAVDNLERIRRARETQGTVNFEMAGEARSEEDAVCQSQVPA